MSVEIYTDGSGYYTFKDGGWACVVRFFDGTDTHEIHMTGFEAMTTNNRMEMGAALAGLGALTQPSTVTVVSDSEYLVNGFNQYLSTWLVVDPVAQLRGEEKLVCSPKRPNADLWNVFLFYKGRHKIVFVHTPGHKGHPENELCDKLAGAARKEKRNEVTWFKNGQVTGKTTENRLKMAIDASR